MFYNNYFVNNDDGDGASDDVDVDNDNDAKKMMTTWKTTAMMVLTKMTTTMMTRMAIKK